MSLAKWHQEQTTPAADYITKMAATVSRGGRRNCVWDKMWLNTRFNQQNV